MCCFFLSCGVFTPEPPFLCFGGACDDVNENVWRFRSVLGWLREVGGARHEWRKASEEGTRYFLVGQKLWENRKSILDRVMTRSKTHLGVLCWRVLQPRTGKRFYKLTCIYRLIRDTRKSDCTRQKLTLATHLEKLTVGWRRNSPFYRVQRSQQFATDLFFYKWVQSVHNLFM